MLLLEIKNLSKNFDNNCILHEINFSISKGENISFKKAHFDRLYIPLEDKIEYQENKIVSKALANYEKLAMTLLAFEGQQQLSTHSAPGDAL